VRSKRKETPKGREQAAYRSSFNSNFGISFDRERNGSAFSWRPYISTREQKKRRRKQEAKQKRTIKDRIEMNRELNCEKKPNEERKKRKKGKTKERTATALTQFSSLEAHPTKWSNLENQSELHNSLNQKRKRRKGKREKEEHASFS
jgi:hypothetical protein